MGFDPDVIIECTGVGSVIIDSIRNVGAGGVVCLTGVGSGGQPSGLSPADVAKELVLAEQRGHRLGQRQPPALLPGGRRARRRRPGLARAADLAPGAAPEHRRRAASAAQTTSRSSWTSEADDGNQRNPSRTAVLSPAPPSRPSSVRAFGGTPVATRCWRSTSWPGASPAAGSATTARWSAPMSTSCLDRRDDRAHRGRRRLAARRRARLRLPGTRRHPPHHRRGLPGRDPDERRRLRSPGPVLGRDAGRRPPRGRRRALPAGPDRPDRGDARAISRSPTESAGAPTAGRCTWWTAARG